jgi:hypothetical protein
MAVLSDPKDTASDNAAGVGVIFFAIPTLVVMAALLVAGAGLGQLSRKSRVPGR